MGCLKDRDVEIFRLVFDGLRIHKDWTIKDFFSYCCDGAEVTNDGWQKLMVHVMPNSRNDFRDFPHGPPIQTQQNEGDPDCSVEQNNRGALQIQQQGNPKFIIWLKHVGFLHFVVSHCLMRTY